MGLQENNLVLSSTKQLLATPKPLTYEGLPLLVTQHLVVPTNRIGKCKRWSFVASVREHEELSLLVSLLPETIEHLVFCKCKDDTDNECIEGLVTFKTPVRINIVLGDMNLSTAIFHKAIPCNRYDNDAFNIYLSPLYKEGGIRSKLDEIARKDARIIQREILINKAFVEELFVKYSMRYRQHPGLITNFIKRTESENIDEEIMSLRQRLI